MPNTIIRIDVFESSPLQQKTCTAEEPTGDSLSIQPVIIDNYRFWGIVFVSDISYNQIISQNISSLMCKHCQRNSPRVKCSKQVSSLDPNEIQRSFNKLILGFNKKYFTLLGNLEKLLSSCYQTWLAIAKFSAVTNLSSILSSVSTSTSFWMASSTAGVILIKSTKNSFLQGQTMIELGSDKKQTLNNCFLYFRIFGFHLLDIPVLVAKISENRSLLAIAIERSTTCPRALPKQHGTAAFPDHHSPCNVRGHFFKIFNNIQNVKRY